MTSPSAAPRAGAREQCSVLAHVEVPLAGRATGTAVRPSTRATQPRYSLIVHDTVAPIDVTGGDHIYLAVRDFERSIEFYDRVITPPIAGERHAHYFNREAQTTIRPVVALRNMRVLVGEHWSEIDAFEDPLRKRGLVK